MDKKFLVGAGVTAGLLFLFLKKRKSASAPRVSPKVLAFYYGWHSASHSWLLPQTPDYCCTFTPEIGRYLSSDTEVMKQHLKWAEQAGIDALVFSTLGSNFEDNFYSMLKIAEGEKSAVKLSVYYESIDATGSTVEDKAVDDIRDIIETYGSSPMFFTFDGKPVIFVYVKARSQAMGRWSSIISKIKESHDVFLSADGPIIDDSHQQEILDNFDSIHFYQPDYIVPSGISEDIEDTTDKRNRRLAVLNLIKKARDAGLVVVLPVYPGVDSTPVREFYGDYGTVVDRENGEFYKRTWENALGLNPDWVVVTSFNEWYEGTVIEPSTEFGDLYLQLTKEYKDKFTNSRR